MINILNSIGDSMNMICQNSIILQLHNLYMQSEAWPIDRNEFPYRRSDICLNNISYLIYST